eukprot:Sspe_Gene.44792::Locus_22021_Transcript_6_6_Confidence_0.526_Length_424::g.44792::m.44792
MGSALLRLVSPLVDPILRDEDDTDERQRKMLMVPVAIFIALLTLLLFVTAALEGAYVKAGVSLISVCTTTTFLIYVYSTKSAPAHVVGWTAVVVGSTAIYADFWTYGLIDYYTCSVLVIDVLLLCKC